MESSVHVRFRMFARLAILGSLYASLHPLGAARHVHRSLLFPVSCTHEREPTSLGNSRLAGGASGWSRRCARGLGRARTIRRRRRVVDRAELHADVSLRVERLQSLHGDLLAVVFSRP